MWRCTRGTGVTTCPDKIYFLLFSLSRYFNTLPDSVRPLILRRPLALHPRPHGIPRCPILPSQKHFLHRRLPRHLAPRHPPKTPNPHTISPYTPGPILSHGSLHKSSPSLAGRGRQSRISRASHRIRLSCRIPPSGAAILRNVRHLSISRTLGAFLEE